MEDFEVTSAFSDDVYELTYENDFDLYIFDVNVPRDNGFEVLKSLKKASYTIGTYQMGVLP